MLTGHCISINSSRTSSFSATVSRSKTSKAGEITVGAIAYSYKHSKAGKVIKSATGISFKPSQAGKVTRSANVESFRPP